MTTRQIALRAGQIVVSLALLGYLVHTIPMRDVLAALLSARLGWLTCSFALVGVMHLLAAMQMSAILAAQGMTFSVRQIAGINLIANFYGLFLPSYLAGGVIRWHHFSKPEGKRAQALAAMIFSREVEFVTTLGYGIVFYFLANSSASAGFAIVTMVATLAIAVLMVLLSVSPILHSALRAVLALLPLSPHLRARLFKISDCLAEFGRHHHREHLRFVMLCVVRNALGVASFICFAHALRIPAAAMDLGWIRAALDLVLILPISIAGLGVRDASLVAMLHHLGIGSATALAFSFVLLARTLFVALLGGIAEGLRVYYGVAPGLRDRRLKGASGGPL